MSFSTPCSSIYDKALYLEGFQALPICPFRKSKMCINMSMGHSWSDTDRGILKYVGVTLL